MRTHYSVELQQSNYRTGWQLPSQWEYTSHIEAAEYIASKWSAKSNRAYKYIYEATIWETETNREVATFRGGVGFYSQYWIDKTTVSAVVDGEKFSVTLNDQEGEK